MQTTEMFVPLDHIPLLALMFYLDYVFRIRLFGVFIFFYQGLDYVEFHMGDWLRDYGNIVIDSAFLCMRDKFVVFDIVFATFTLQGARKFEDFIVDPILLALLRQLINLMFQILNTITQVYPKIITFAFQK